MATNSMTKSLYAAPQGLDQLGEDEEPLEITVEDPEAVNISGPGFEINIEKSEDDEEFSKYLAEEMNASDLAALSNTLLQD